MLPRSVFIVFATALLVCLSPLNAIAQPGAAASAVAQRPPSSALKVSIVNLPEGAPGRITIGTAAGNRSSLGRPGTLSLAPGTYDVIAEPVHVGKATYYPTAPSQTVHVGVGASAITVDYYDIVPDTTHVLDPVGAKTMTISSGSSHLSVTAGSAVARSLRAGDVLAVAPTAAAPGGLLAKVLSVRTVDGRIEADIRQASFMEAITRGRFSATVIYSPKTMTLKGLPGDDTSPSKSKEANSRGPLNSQGGATTGCSENSPALVLPFDYTLGGQGSIRVGPVGAGGSGGVTLSGSISLCPQLEVDVDWGFLRINSAKVVAHLGEDTAVTASAENSVSVSLEKGVDVGKTPTYPVEVAGVPLILQGKATLTLGVSVEADSSFSASTGQTATAELGLNYANGQMTPIHDASFSIQPIALVRNASITGQAYVGLKLGVTVDEVLFPNVEPRVYLSWTPTPPATLKWGLEGTAGIDVQAGKYVVLSLSTLPLTLFEETWQAPPAAEPPVLSLVTPSAAKEGSSNLTITLSGHNFAIDSVATANGSPLQTWYSGPNVLWATMPSAKMLRTGTFQIGVTDPNSGDVSSALPFAVTPVNDSPVITGMAPQSLPAGSAGQTVTISGKNFQSGSTVTFNGQARTSTYLNADQVSVGLTSGDLGAAGRYAVIVTNPNPDGGPSAPWSFAVLDTSPGAGEWTWISGSDTGGQPGVYGTQGVPAATNMPGARYVAVSWIDANGNAWLFGGDGSDSAGSEGELNDLWEFNPGTRTWIWMSGANTVNQYGVYGTQGMPAATNAPGGRDSAVSWIDASGNLLLFGGVGFGSAGHGGGGDLNDLWEFNLATRTWTWVSGANTVGQVGVYGTQGIPAATNVPSARSNAVSWIDTVGNLWLFGGYGVDSAGNFGGLNDLWEFNPTTGIWTWVSGTNTKYNQGVYGTQGVGAVTNVPGGRYDSTSWIDAAGNLWLFGGVGTDSAGNSDALNDLWEFSPATRKWTWVSGANIIDQPGVYGTEGVPAATNVPGARWNPVSWVDASGHLWLFGGAAWDSAEYWAVHNELWEFNPATRMWTWVSGANTFDQYGVYGTLGTAAATNVPGGRAGAVTWIDASGSLWLFGGIEYGFSSLNDLWRYRPQ